MDEALQKKFIDALEVELDGQELMFDEHEWMTLIKCLNEALKVVEVGSSTDMNGYVEPLQDTVSMEDIMHATPKGREAVQKAIDESIEVQNKMTKKAQNTLKESNNLNTSEEHIKDTSLDGIFDTFTVNGEGDCVVDRTSMLEAISSWHKSEVAKLLQVIEDEVIGKTRAHDSLHIGDLKAEQRQALKKIKERL